LVGLDLTVLQGAHPLTTQFDVMRTALHGW
jgi:hypothetical protein